MALVSVGATLNSVVAAVPLAAEMMAEQVGHLSLAQVEVAVVLVMMKESIPAQEVLVEPGVVIRQGMAYQVEPLVVTLAQMGLPVAMDAVMAAQAVAHMQILLLVGREGQVALLAAELAEVDVAMMAQAVKEEQGEMGLSEFIVGR